MDGIVLNLEILRKGIPPQKEEGILDFDRIACTYYPLYYFNTGRTIRVDHGDKKEAAASPQERLNSCGLFITFLLLMQHRSC